ncbi:hypothetical protein SLS53_000665 [Cytospora paraplurivora]|uniref:Uncharacterized protein n=1 Tax=Cytospora paraplurivora TaxID=2898453 RepID=A0AAN9UHW7_9PEZI
MKKSQASTGKAMLPRLGLCNFAATLPALEVLDSEAVVLVELDVLVRVLDVVRVPDLESCELEDAEPVDEAPEIEPPVDEAPEPATDDVAPPAGELAVLELAGLDPVAEGVELGDCPELADDAAVPDAVELPDVGDADVEITEDALAETGVEVEGDEADDDPPKDEDEALPLVLLEGDSALDEANEDGPTELAVLDADPAEDGDVDSADDEDADWVDKMLIDALVAET